MDKELRDALIVLSEQAGREIDTYRHRQISTFREFAIVQAVITWGVGQLKLSGEALHRTRLLAAVVCFLAGVLGCWIIQIYKRRIYFVRDQRKNLIVSKLRASETQGSADRTEPSALVKDQDGDSVDLFYPTKVIGPAGWLDIPSSTAYTFALLTVSVATAIANLITAIVPGAVAP